MRIRHCPVLLYYRPDSVVASKTVKAAMKYQFCPTPSSSLLSSRVLWAESFVGPLCKGTKTHNPAGILLPLDQWEAGITYLMRPGTNGRRELGPTRRAANQITMSTRGDRAEHSGTREDT